MEVLGIGPLELLFIIVIIIVVIGPKDIQRTMRGIGRGLNSLYKSESWKAFNEVSRELRTLPNRLARDAELEELDKASKEITQAIAATTPSLSAWTKPVDGKKIAPPAAPAGEAAKPGNAAEPPQEAPAAPEPAPKPEPEPASAPEPLPESERGNASDSS
jgi:Sec-independent protein translocase protein TatA